MWLTLPDIADARLPDLPRSVKGLRSLVRRERWQRAEWQFPAYPDGRWRRRSGTGGGIEYHISILPLRAQEALKRRQSSPDEALTSPSGADETPPADGAMPTSETLWRRFQCLTPARQDGARRRLAILDEIDALTAAGDARSEAIRTVGERYGVGRATLWSWLQAVRGVTPGDRLPALADRRGDRRSADEDACSPEAWAVFKADYLRLERPSMATCYRRLQRIADREAWAVPSQRTLQRRLNTECSAASIVLAREGVRALQRLYPAQRRDRSDLAAMQLLNADGRRHDIWVQWPDGEIGRPVTVAFQDVYSGKVLGWRHDRTEHKEVVRLAFGDVADTWGLPDDLVLDNGRGFAAKWLTGGTPTRFRFRVRDEDPIGLYPALGITVHWAMPHHGQAKPIERRFRDMADEIDRHPVFAGAWCGNRPDAKPENYRTRAVPYEVFAQVFAEEVRAADARPGRRSVTCAGRSIDETFQDSYRTTVVRWAAVEQRRLWLLAAEGVTARKPTGELHLMGNRYWAEELTGHIGQRVIVRFDPAHLHRPLSVHALDNRFICDAACIDDTGFVDHEAARTQARAVRDWVRATRAALTAERRLTIDKVAALLPRLPDTDEAPVPPPVVRPVFGRANGTTGAAEPVPDGDEDVMANFRRGVERLRRRDG